MEEKTMDKLPTKMDFVTPIHEHLDIYATYGELLHKGNIDQQAFTTCKVITDEVRQSNRPNIEIYEFQALGFYQDQPVSLHLYAKIEEIDGKKSLKSFSPVATLATDPDTFIYIPEDLLRQLLIVRFKQATLLVA